MCESIDGNLEAKEVMSYPRAVPLGKRTKRYRALLKRKGKQASCLGFTQKEDKDSEEPARV